MEVREGGRRWKMWMATKKVSNKRKQLVVEVTGERKMGGWAIYRVKEL